MRANAFDDIRDAIGAAEQWQAQEQNWARVVLVLDRAMWTDAEEALAGPPLREWDEGRFLLLNTSKPSDYARVAVWDATAWLG